MHMEGSEIMVVRFKEWSSTHPNLYRLFIISISGISIYHLGYVIGKFIYYITNI